MHTLQLKAFLLIHFIPLYGKRSVVLKLMVLKLCVSLLMVVAPTENSLE